MVNALQALMLHPHWRMVGWERWRFLHAVLDPLENFVDPTVRLTSRAGVATAPSNPLWRRHSSLRPRFPACPSLKFRHAP